MNAHQLHTRGPRSTLIDTRALMFYSNRMMLVLRGFLKWIWAMFSVVPYLGACVSPRPSLIVFLPQGEAFEPGDTFSVQGPRGEPVTFELGDQVSEGRISIPLPGTPRMIARMINRHVPGVAARKTFLEEMVELYSMSRKVDWKITHWPGK